jgi:hypothetical protein
MSVAVFVCTAAAARPEAVAIDHKGVGCIVVGKYPRMDACFTPAASLARSRVYFRPEGDQAWYYVDMKGEGSCYSGTLPRPGKKLLGKTIEYYVDAQNKASEPSRSPSFEPRVVKSAEDCDKDKPVAPFLNSARLRCSRHCRGLRRRGARDRRDHRRRRRGSGRGGHDRGRDD